MNVRFLEDYQQPSEVVDSMQYDVICKEQEAREWGVPFQLCTTYNRSMVVNPNDGSKTRIDSICMESTIQGAYDDFDAELVCGSSPCTWSLCIELECRLTKGCNNDRWGGCIDGCNCRNIVLGKILGEVILDQDGNRVWGETVVSECDVCQDWTTNNLLQVAMAGGNLTDYGIAVPRSARVVTDYDDSVKSWSEFLGFMAWVEPDPNNFWLDNVPFRCPQQDVSAAILGYGLVAIAGTCLVAFLLRTRRRRRPPVAAHFNGIQFVRLHDDEAVVIDG